jgi:hypothetical protein
MSAGVYVGPSTTRLESASAVGSPHERCEMGLLAPSGMAPDIAPLIRATFENVFRLSFPAKAGNPVRRGLSGLTAASGILGRPVKPDDDVGD